MDIIKFTGTIIGEDYTLEERLDIIIELCNNGNIIPYMVDRIISSEYDIELTRFFDKHQYIGNIISELKISIRDEKLKQLGI